MTQKHRWLLGGGVAAASLGALLLVAGQGIVAADHFDPPLRTDTRPEIDPTPDRLADIADVFATYDPANVNLAVTIHTREATISSPLTDTYDPNVLYGLNISTGGSEGSPEVGIRFRFGPGTNGSGFGVRFENLPGVTGVLDCRVEDTNCQVSTPGGVVRAYVGLRDDPFFFDVQGFRDTVRTGDLMFNRRDFFAGKNILSVVLQIPRENLANTNRIGVWATSARLGGQL